MIATFQGQLELREIAIISNKICHRYSLHRRMEFVTACKNTLTSVTESHKNERDFKKLYLNGGKSEKSQ